jgi:DNA-directed RNA polymerase subunit RPC12/RpoP
MTTVKPKRLMAVGHADGRVEYVCPKCGQKMDITEHCSHSLSRGEYDQDNTEALVCECGYRTETIPAPVMDMHSYIEHDHGWADLDHENKKNGHYGRGMPGWLINAKDKLERLCKKEIATIDAWEKGQAHDMDVAIIQVEREEAEKEYSRLYEFWSASLKKLEGTHINTVTNMVPEWEKSTQKA